MQPTTWTDELRVKVTLLWESHSAQEISAILWETDRVNKSRNAVIGILHRMSLTSNDKIEVHPRSNAKCKPKLSQRPPKPQGNQASRKIELRCVEVVPQHVSLSDLDGCRYPYGDGPFTFCNHPMVAESSYCGPHKAACWASPIKTWARAS